MKLSLRQGLSLAALLAGTHLALPAVANTCSWDGGISGPMDFQADVGNVYVPRDAKIGSIIGVIDKFVQTPNPGNRGITCSNDGSVILNFNAIPTAPSDRRVHEPIGGEDSSGKIFMTNIPGVGARITLEFGFDGMADNSFVPIGGRSIVPFDAQISRTLLSPFALSRLRSKVTLVKTGPIPPGPHILSRQIFDGHFSDIGKGFAYGVRGTVIQAQCAVGANPVSVDPVPLGDWDAKDFTAPGFTTPATSFTISLSSCVADPFDANRANAHIRLDGANGSIPEGDGSQGVFHLSPASTAAGMGIQILRGDGVSPVPLGTDVSFGAIEDGKDKTLEFKARFYQIKNSADIRPGKAEGALSFTITYQ
ncbi:fimbrial protein [Pseudomonas izuensis]|uniref:fimbrial protein n=1 Tax=Pseudomonas izuensis TaxID=2684212 RepID=UPI0013594823|nr:fimbrial protein [Pseudomonas izuensis]